MRETVSIVGDPYATPSIGAADQKHFDTIRKHASKIHLPS